MKNRTRNPKPARRLSGRSDIRRGFTMVELLVVLSIIVFLAGVTAAAVWPYMEGQALRSGARTVQAMLLQTRAYAITNRTRAALYFDAAEKQMVLVGRAEDMADYLAASEENKKQYRGARPEFLPKGTQFGTTDDGSGTTYVVANSAGAGYSDCIVFDTTGAVGGDMRVLKNGTPVAGTVGNLTVSIQDVAGQTTKTVEVLFTSGIARVLEN
jgi:prepilin-type N-terminal cleavage/methylation domain-containing protein